jgi:hypothetical protein
MCSGRSDWALPQPGFPIRRSTDQSLVDSSPWLIAATHVLHRHLAPRHPPLALCSLKIAHSSALPRETKSKESHFALLKMLVLAMQFSKVAPRSMQISRRRYAYKREHRAEARLDRSHAPVLPCEETTQSKFDGAASSKQSSEHPVERGPVVPMPARPRERDWRLHRGRTDPSGRVASVDVGTLLVYRERTSRTKTVLFLRKEVIQPHLPVRLPCYDFTPIANPTFDSSLPKGLGHWLRVLPTFVV